MNFLDDILYWIPLECVDIIKEYALCNCGACGPSYDTQIHMWGKVRYFVTCDEQKELSQRRQFYLQQCCDYCGKRFGWSYELYKYDADLVIIKNKPYHKTCAAYLNRKWR